MKKIFILQPIMWLIIFTVVGCIRHEVAPIHITLDVNIKIDKELDNFFSGIDSLSE